MTGLIQMRPEFSSANSKDGRSAHAESFREQNGVSFLCKTLPDGKNITVSELRTWTSLSLKRRKELLYFGSEPVFPSMNKIPSNCDPLKVFWAVVSLYSIYVVYLISGWSRTVESLTYKLMGGSVGLFPVIVQDDSRVTVTIYRLAPDLCRMQAPYSSKAGNLIEALVAHDWKPNLGDILEFIHDIFPSYGKWLWLEPMRVCNHLLGSLILPSPVQG